MRFLCMHAVDRDHAGACLPLVPYPLHIIRARSEESIAKKFRYFSFACIPDFSEGVSAQASFLTYSYLDSIRIWSYVGFSNKVTHFLVVAGWVNLKILLGTIKVSSNVQERPLLISLQASTEQRSHNSIGLIVSG